MALDVDTGPVRALKDRLLRMGRPSVVPGALGSFSEPAVDAELGAASVLRVRPFAELMFLVMVSDRQVTDSERAALRGAFRALTGGRFRSSVLDEMLVRFRAALEVEGWEGRLEHICAELALDRQDAEGAFTLAAAMSLADGALRDPERAVLDRLADWLGLGRSRSEALLHDVCRRG